VGEPINPEAWNRVQRERARGRPAVCVVRLQTETGSIVITPFSGVPTKPGSACATVSFFWACPAILDPITVGGEEG
ncbi:hypothetical protein B0H13DRAFT_1539979, partial [Mycena leptocephala]